MCGHLHANRFAVYSDMTFQTGDPFPQKTDPDYSREQEIKILEAVDRISTSGVLGAGERMPALLGYLVR